MKSLLSLLQRHLALLISLLVTMIVLFLMSQSFWWALLLVFSLPLLVLSLRDFLQRGNSIARIYPGIAHLRWLAYSLRPYLRQYIVADDLEPTPFSYQARSLIYARARGNPDTHPFGSERLMGEAGYHWYSHSMMPAVDPDTRPTVEVGNEQSTQTYRASLLNISAMSFGSLSQRAVEALNLGAKQGGFYHDTGEGGLSRHHLKHGGDLVWEIGTGYFGCRDKNGKFDPEKFREGALHEAVKMTEIKLSQGAKPGHGGLLPAAKVTREIAEVRGVKAHEDCLSPPGHSAFSTPVEMLEFAARMRELSGGKPVGLKMCVGQPHQVMALMKAMRKSGIYPDFIVVDGGEGGTGAAPLELSDWVGMPLVEGLVMMQNALVGSGLRQQVRLVASGKIYSAMGLARCLAIGADWCNVARAFMFSIGCVQAQRCHTGTCPTGITTQDQWRQRGLVVEVQAERAARFHRKTLESLANFVATAGLEHPRDLEPHHITTRTSAVEAHEMDRVHKFLPENALLEAPEETDYASWWEAASPDSFHPQRPLQQLRTDPPG